MVDQGLSEEQFRALFEAAPTGVMAVDATGRIVLLNAQVEKMFGYSRAELIDQSVEVLVPVRFRRNHTSLRESFAAAPQMRPMGIGRDLFGERKDGSEFPIEIGLNFTATSLGGVFNVTIVDITERKRAEEQKTLLERAQAKVRICQLLGMPAAVLQRDGQVLFLNPLLTTLNSQLTVANNRVEVSDPAVNERFRQALHRLDGRDSDEIVGPIPVPGAGDHLPLIFNLLPVKGLFGCTLGVLVVTTIKTRDMPSADLVRRLFALAPAEARVAALIGAGLSPQVVAKRLGISEGNVRTTLKRVFTKIGVSRQNELSALLSKLALHQMPANSSIS